MCLKKSKGGAIMSEDNENYNVSAIATEIIWRADDIDYFMRYSSFDDDGYGFCDKEIYEILKPAKELVEKIYNFYKKEIIKHEMEEARVNGELYPRVFVENVNIKGALTSKINPEDL